MNHGVDWIDHQEEVDERIVKKHREKESSRLHITAFPTNEVLDKANLSWVHISRMKYVIPTKTPTFTTITIGVKCNKVALCVSCYQFQILSV